MNLQKIIERLESLTPKLQDLGNTMYSKWGTESYNERCINYDVRDELIKITKEFKAQEESKSVNKSAEEILFDVMTEAGFSYVSFPSFVENENSVDVFDICLRAIEYAQSHQVEMPREEEIERASKIEIDPGVITDFHNGKDFTALRRRMWSYGAEWMREQIKSKIK